MYSISKTHVVAKILLALSASCQTRSLDSVARRRLGVPQRNCRGAPDLGPSEAFNPGVRRKAERFLHRPDLLNVSGEKDNDSAGTYDGQGEPDDAPEWPAKSILLPNGNQQVNGAG